MTLNDVIQDIHGLNTELAHLERRYGLLSEDFYSMISDPVLPTPIHIISMFHLTLNITAYQHRGSVSLNPIYLF